MFGTDYWFQWPVGGIRDALVDLSPGELYPWQLSNDGTLHPVTGRPCKADPLGEGHAYTWSMRLIKIATRIKVTARRVRMFLTGLGPFLDHFRDVVQALLRGP